MNKFKFFFLILLSTFIAFQSFGQTGDYAKYRISFTDKNQTPYTFTNPHAYLSDRAIERRIKQNISIDSTDIPVNKSYIQAVLDIGGIYLHRSKWFNFITIALPDTSLLSQINDLVFVKNIERTYPMFGKKSEKNETETGEQSLPALKTANVNCVNTNHEVFDTKSLQYGMSENQNNMIGIQYLHAHGYRGQDMIIGVFDAGFFRVDSLGIFDSLRAEGRILGAIDFVEPARNVYISSTHGMSVLSTMAANKTGVMVGTAPKASYWLFRTEDAVTEYRIEEDNWIAAAEFADSAGIDIINSSLGYTEFWDSSQNYTYADMDGKTAQITKGAEMAFAKGIFVVNSAGNSGNSPWRYIGAPADGANVFSIGAVNENGKLASFSSVGPTSDGRIKPNVVAQGQGSAVINSNNNVISGNGTSFSGPIVAGAVACLWQANPTLTNVELKHYIEKSASLYPKKDTLFGYGIPNFAAAHILISQSDEIKEEPFLLIYPNPFETELFVIYHSPRNQLVNIEIHDANGRRTISKETVLINIGYNNISIQNLKSSRKGVYILRIIAGDKVYSKQIVKI